METVEVSLQERSYSILIGTGILSKTPEFLSRRLDRFVHAVILCDTSVLSTFGATIQAQLSGMGIRVSLLEIPSGEASKSIEQLARIWEFLVSDRADRGTVFFAVGGGVVGDLAGFAAAHSPEACDLFRSLRLCFLTWTAAWAARPVSTYHQPRTWSVPSGNPLSC